MKKTELLMGFLLIFTSACENKDREESQDIAAIEMIAPVDSAAKANVGTATGKYAGTINGKEVVFEHWRHTSYRLTEAGKITEGELNTERGFGDDRDATVFVLDFEKPETAQKYFVRFSDGRFVMLDAQRKLLPGALTEQI